MTRRNQSKISKLRMLAIPLAGTCTDICDKRSEMNKRLLKTVVGLSLVIVGLLAIVSCVPGEYRDAEAASLEVIPTDLIARAGAASLARWQGLGEQYTASSRAEDERAGTADTTRWEARGAFYKNMAESQLTRGQAANVARLQAMGEHFSAPLVVPNTADATRWEARGAFYKNMAESQLARGQAANAARWQAMGEHSSVSAAAAGNQLSTDVARWVALGESYEQLAQAGDEVSADVARWIGLGEHYK
jgi:hypothetical protein